MPCGSRIASLSNYLWFFKGEGRSALCHDRSKQALDVGCALLKPPGPLDTLDSGRNVLIAGNHGHLLTAGATASHCLLDRSGRVLTGAAVAVSYHLTGPPPPKKVRLATGEKGGAYAEFGRQYAEILAKNGLEVELVETAGGIDNFHRLRDGQVDVAFMQSGTYDRVEDTDRVVRGIAALGLEPLWVICRDGDK